MSECASSKGLFSNSSPLLPSVLISMFISFTSRDFHFSLCCYVPHVVSEVVRGLLALPSAFTGRNQELYFQCIWISLFPVVVSLPFCLCPLCFGSAQQCARRHGATPGVLVLLGRAEVHLFLWARSASAWTLLLAAEAGHLSGTLAVLFRPYTCTPQQSKPLLYEPPAMLCLNLSKPQAKSLVASNPDCSSWGWAQQGGSIAFSY